MSLVPFACIADDLSRLFAGHEGAVERAGNLAQTLTFSLDELRYEYPNEGGEEVIQRIYQRYGRHRAGLCATVVHYPSKRTIREVGRAMGLSEDTISALSFQLWGFFSSKGLEAQRMAEIGLDPNDRRLNQTMQLVYEIDGFPQHLSMTCGGARGWPLPLFAQGLEGEAIDEPAAKMWLRITSPCG